MLLALHGAGETEMMRQHSLTRSFYATSVPACKQAQNTKASNTSQLAACRGGRILFRLGDCLPVGSLSRFAESRFAQIFIQQNRLSNLPHGFSALTALPLHCPVSRFFV